MSNSHRTIFHSCSLIDTYIYITYVDAHLTYWLLLKSSKGIFDQLNGSIGGANNNHYHFAHSILACFWYETSYTISLLNQWNSHNKSLICIVCFETFVTAIFDLPFELKNWILFDLIKSWWRWIFALCEYLLLLLVCNFIWITENYSHSQSYSLRHLLKVYTSMYIGTCQQRKNGYVHFCFVFVSL